jgi:hypothetical protein
MSDDEINYFIQYHILPDIYTKEKIENTMLEKKSWNISIPNILNIPICFSLYNGFIIQDSCNGSCNLVCNQDCNRDCNPNSNQTHNYSPTNMKNKNENKNKNKNKNNKNQPFNLNPNPAISIIHPDTVIPIPQFHSVLFHIIENPIDTVIHKKKNKVGGSGSNSRKKTTYPSVLSIQTKQRNGFKEKNTKKNRISKSK